MAKLIKTLGRQPLVQRALASLAAGLMVLVRATTRWRKINTEAAAPAWAGQTPVIVAFWHNRLALMPVCWPSKSPFHMLISSHPDGRLIAGTIAHFGVGSVAGSSTRGGGEALRQLVRLLKNGASVGVTPDGPRGPRMTVGDGVIALARLAQVPILPAAVSVSAGVVLNTWDRLIIPLPFGRGAVIWGKPIAVPRDADETAVADLRDTLEKELVRLSTEADVLAGRAPITREDISNARA